MVEKKPLVSIIITTYKGNKNLIRAINSSINQTYNNVELIVVDDNNPNTEYREDTEKLMAQFQGDARIKYIKHDRNKNGAAARNTGIAHAGGDYITFLDDDDIYLPNRIERCVKYLLANTDKKGVISSVIFMSSNSFYNVRTAHQSNYYQRDLLIDNNLLGTGSNIFIKKSCLKTLKGFDVDFLRFQDVEFMLRFLGQYKLGAINEVLIIKDSGDSNRRPNYSKIKSMAELFTKKFAMTISKLNENDQKLFYRNLYRMLYYAALNSNDKSIIEKSKNEYLQYDKLTIKDRLYGSYIIRKIAKYNKKNILNKYSTIISEDNYRLLKEMGR